MTDSKEVEEEVNIAEFLTDQSQEQEQNSKGIRFKLWTYSSENKETPEISGGDIEQRL